MQARRVSALRLCRWPVRRRPCLGGRRTTCRGLAVHPPPRCVLVRVPDSIDPPLVRIIRGFCVLQPCEGECAWYRCSVRCPDLAPSHPAFLGRPRPHVLPGTLGIRRMTTRAVVRSINEPSTDENRRGPIVRYADCFLNDVEDGRRGKETTVIACLGLPGREEEGTRCVMHYSTNEKPPTQEPSARFSTATAVVAALTLPVVAIVAAGAGTRGPYCGPVVAAPAAASAAGTSPVARRRAGPCTSRCTRWSR